MLKLRAPHHAAGDKNRYCGPSAISAVTNLTTGEAARLIRFFGYRPGGVKGTDAYEVGRALKECGIRMVMLADKAIGTRLEPTLAAWLDASASVRTAGRVFLLVAGNHWQVISGRRYVCGIAGAVVDFNHKAVKRRSRVTSVYELHQEAPVLKVPAKAKKPAAVKRAGLTAEDIARLAFKRLAVLYGADVEYEAGRDCVPVVWGLRDFEIDDNNDPYASDHLPDSWQDALERLQAYIKIKESLT